MVNAPSNQASNVFEAALVRNRVDMQGKATLGN
jgi:hypothetical protein